MPAAGFLPNTARLIALLTMLSRVLGLIRESVFAHYFSTSELLSAFRIAFMVPNLARRLFGEGALSAAMIPILTDSLRTGDEQTSRRFFGTLLLMLAAVLIGCLALIEGTIGVWRVVHDDLALKLTAILMPYMVLICLVAVASGVLNVRNHFAVPAAAPTILNVAIIVAAVLGSYAAGLRDTSLMVFVCWAIVLSGVLQLLGTWLALRQVRFTPLPGGSLRDPRLRLVWRLMGPMVLGLSAVQINSLLDYLIAYAFVVQDGERVGPAILGYAQYLYQLPLGVAGISIATAIFPVLARKAAEEDRTGLADTIGKGVRLGAFIALPAAIGLIMVAHPLVAALYQRGGFDEADTRRVAATLVLYSLGLPAYFAQHVVVRAFYALHDSKTPARVAMCMVGLDLALNLALVFVMEERGMALSTSICATIQVLWLGAILTRLLPEMRWRNIAMPLGKMLIGAAVMAAVLWTIDSPGILGEYLYNRSIYRLAVLVTAGVASYGLAVWLLRVKELRTMLRSTSGESGVERSD